MFNGFAILIRGRIKTFYCFTLIQSRIYFVLDKQNKVLSNIIFGSIIGEKASENIKSAAGDVSKDITKG